MKNKYKTFFWVVSFALSLLKISACTEIKTQDQIANKPSASDLKFADINLQTLNGRSHSIPAKNGYDYQINYTTAGVAASSMKAILETFKRRTLIEDESTLQDNPEMVVFYTKNNHLSDLNINKVVAFSTWHTKSNTTTAHKLYRINQDGLFKVDEKYSVDCGVIINTDINYIAATVYPNQEINWIGYWTIGVSDKKADKPKLLSLSRTVLDNSPVILYSEALSGCDACSYAGPRCTPIGDCDNLVPQPGDCAATTTNTFTIPSARIGAFNLDAIRLMRDNIISKSTKGRQYIGYYYKLSQIASTFGTIDQETSTDHAILAQDALSIIKSYQTGGENDIVVNRNTADNILKMVQNYRTICKNKELQKILDMIEEDVNNTVNIKRSDIIKFIE